MSNRSLVVALAQMVSRMASPACELTSVNENWLAAEALVYQSAQQGAELVVLPENFLTFGSSETFSIEEQQAWVQRLSLLATKANVWLVCGTLPLQLANAIGEPLMFSGSVKPYAACLVFNNSGAIEGEYRKVHLFDADVNDDKHAYRESESYCAGDAPVVISTPWGCLGIAVCYDLRFPEYFRLLRERGADFIAVPAAFTYVTGKAHWHILVRARAIETQSFMLACGQGGEHSTARKTWGESMIVNPWGEILGALTDGEGVVVAELDTTVLAQVRSTMLVMQHHRF